MNNFFQTLFKNEEEDPLYNETVSFAIQKRQIFAADIQRKFKIGYNRALTLIETMREMGVIDSENTALISSEGELQAVKKSTLRKLCVRLKRLCKK